MSDPQYDFHPIHQVSKNASMGDVIGAVRKSERQWWQVHREWHKRWLNFEGDQTENIHRKDTAAERASELKAIADHLERLST